MSEERQEVKALRLLAIEASAKVCGAAVLADGQILAEQSVNGALTHSETLMPMVAAVLAASGVPKETLNLIAFTAGPGSFTGLRIGASTAKGLALALNLPVMPLSTLEALAYGAVGFNGWIVPVMDARRHQVYSAAYKTEGGCLVRVLEQRAIPAEELLGILAERTEPVLLLGDAAVLYAESYRRVLKERLSVAAPHLRQLRAGAVAALAAAKYEDGQRGIPSYEVELTYLRKPQAEREREERLRKEAAHE